MNPEWSPIEIEYKEISQNKKTLDNIITGKSPALIIRNFYNNDSCKILVQRIEKETFGNNEKMKKIGVSLASFISRKTEYFLQAEIVRKKMFRAITKIRDKFGYASIQFGEIVTKQRNVAASFFGMR